MKPTGGFSNHVRHGQLSSCTLNYVSPSVHPKVSLGQQPLWVRSRSGVSFHLVAQTSHEFDRKFDRAGQVKFFRQMKCLDGAHAATSLDTS
jgi:hypothetical protein